MNAPTKLAGFAAGLALVFGGAALAGGAVDPEPPGADAPVATGAHGHAAPAEDSDPMPSDTRSSSTAGHGGGGAAHPVRGLAVAEDGLRLVVDDPELRRGAAERLRFRVVDEHGATVRAFDVEHEKRMHLIVARRDLTGFQHLHPMQGRDGAWTTSIRLKDAGSYRLFADFARDGEASTLASDLRVDGAADLRDLPAPASAATSDGGYDVRLAGGRASAGKASELRFAVTKDGRTVHTEPYLGAGGHLVALREGDLAFLHVHPVEDGHDEGADAHDDSIGFEATFPTTGRYRLFLQFKHEGRIQTAAFTEEVT